MRSKSPGPRTERLTIMSTAPFTTTDPRATQDFRLNRRGRLVFHGLPLLALVAVVTLALAVFSSTALSPATASDERAAAELETVTVGYGDSLWQIAQEVAPEADPQETIQTIADLNNLDSSELSTGQSLYVPVTIDS